MLGWRTDIPTHGFHPRMADNMPDGIRCIWQMHSRNRQVVYPSPALGFHEERRYCAAGPLVNSVVSTEVLCGRGFCVPIRLYNMLWMLLSRHLTLLNALRYSCRPSHRPLHIAHCPLPTAHCPLPTAPRLMILTVFSYSDGGYPITHRGTGPGTKFGMVCSVEAVSPRESKRRS